MKEIPTNIGDVITARRMKASMTRKELAANAGVALSTLSAIERGAHMPSARTLDFIAEAFGTSSSRLIATAKRKAKAA